MECIGKYQGPFQVTLATLMGTEWQKWQQFYYQIV